MNIREKAKVVTDYVVTDLESGETTRLAGALPAVRIEAKAWQLERYEPTMRLYLVRSRISEADTGHPVRDCRDWVRPCAPKCHRAEGHDWGRAGCRALGAGVRTWYVCPHCRVRHYTDTIWTDPTTGEQFPGMGDEIAGYAAPGDAD